MLTIILNKILTLLFFLSILNIIRHAFFLVKNITYEETFVISKKSLIILGISIAYILTTITTGITIL